MTSTATLQLETRRFIPATPQRVLDAWTTPEALLRWWGPAGVRCVAAEVDLRVGGRYRIGNEMPDKSLLWIEGEFERVEAPRLLVYTWRVGEQPTPTERVTVRFEAVGDGTEVTVLHERIATAALRDQHLAGWDGCLEGLARYFSANGRITPAARS